MLGSCGRMYGPEYYAQSPVDDPTGPDSGIDRIYRGGGWDCSPFVARSAVRYAGMPFGRGMVHGFRIARNE